LDPSPDAIARAGELYDTAVVGTLEGTDLADLGGHQFDVIIVADVLEHLVDPGPQFRLVGEPLPRRPHRPRIAGR